MYIAAAVEALREKRKDRMKLNFSPQYLINFRVTRKLSRPSTGRETK